MGGGLTEQRRCVMNTLGNVMEKSKSMYKMTSAYENKNSRYWVQCSFLGLECTLLQIPHSFLTSLYHSITSSVSLRNFPKYLFPWDVLLSLSCVVVAKSCLTLCDAMDCSLPVSSVHEIFQARILEWVVISSSRRSS